MVVYNNVEPSLPVAISGGGWAEAAATAAAAAAAAAAFPLSNAEVVAADWPGNCARWPKINGAPRGWACRASGWLAAIAATGMASDFNCSGSKPSVRHCCWAVMKKINSIG